MGDRGVVLVRFGGRGFFGLRFGVGTVYGRDLYKGVVRVF